MTPVLQACLNGVRPPDAHPAIPITPHQLARDAHAVAACAHLGPATPDTVAVNVGEPGWRETCAAAHTHAIGLELCIHTAADAIHLHHTGLPPGVQRITAEVTIADPIVALAEADHILKALGTVGVPVGLHGQDTAAWPVWHYATQTGLHTRIGLEDTLTRPNGTPTTGNPDLIHHALRLTPIERAATIPRRPARPPPTPTPATGGRGSEGSLDWPLTGNGGFESCSLGVPAPCLPSVDEQVVVGSPCVVFPQ